MSIVQWLLLILMVVLVGGVYLYMRRQAASDPWRDMDEPEETLDDSAAMNGDSYVVGVRTLNRETPADRKAAAAARAEQGPVGASAPDRTRAMCQPTTVRRRPAPPEPEPEPLPRRRATQVHSSELDTPRGLWDDQAMAAGEETPQAPRETPSPATTGLATPGGDQPGVQRVDMVAPQPEPQSEVFKLFVAAPDGMMYEGQAVHDTLVACDLQFGLNDLYHRTTEVHGVTESVFAVANMVQPGTLHPADAPDLASPGLALFLLVPGPMEGRAAMHDMMETAHRITQHLGGTVLDDKHALLKAQTAQFVLDQITEIDRRARLAKRR